MTAEFVQNDKARKEFQGQVQPILDRLRNPLGWKENLRNHTERATAPRVLVYWEGLLGELSKRSKPDLSSLVFAAADCIAYIGMQSPGSRGSRGLPLQSAAPLLPKDDLTLLSGYLENPGLKPCARAQVALALGWVGGEQDLDSLRRCLVTTPPEEVQEMVVKALILIGGPKGMEAINLAARQLSPKARQVIFMGGVARVLEEQAGQLK